MAFKVKARLPSACELISRIRRAEISAREVVSNHYAEIRRTNQLVNAMCTLVPEASALAQADAIDAKVKSGAPLGLLAGLPVAIKDLSQTKDLRTTYGSPIYENYIPLKNDLPIERIIAADGIVIGKSNTSEFGAGSQTFNSLFGTTHNPYDLSRTAGGSSGGSAAALACGMVPLAIGSDLGGSLRNPASWCGVVGFRPSLNRVPDMAHKLPWSGLGVTGPMARTVDDTALLLAAIAGPSNELPNCLPEPGERFLPPIAPWTQPCTIAFSANLAGKAAVEPAIRQATRAACKVLEGLGHRIVEQEPDFCAEALEVFTVSRSMQYVHSHTNHAKVHGKRLKATIRQDVERGQQLSVEQIVKAEEKRNVMFRKMAKFFDKFDFLVLPVCAVDPFSSDREWPDFIDGQPAPDHLAWMRLCSIVSALGCPAISVPAGLSAAGFPLGLQIVGKPQCDLAVLRLAKAFESNNSLPTALLDKALRD